MMINPSGHLTPSSSPSTPPSSPEGKKESKSLDGLKRFAIISTNMLPFSSRGVAATALGLPIRLTKSLTLGVKQAIRDKSVASLGPTFVKTAKEKIATGWKGGISDSYTNLSSEKHRELGKELAQQNMRYAGYMYDFNIENRRANRNFPEWKGETVSSNALKGEGIPDELKEKFRALIEDKIKGEMGFKEDAQGKFYNTETGTIFTIVYDTTDKQHPEIIFCFEGLGNEGNLCPISKEKQKEMEEHKDQVGKESVKGAVADYFGGIPPSARQAMDLGKMLSTFGEENNITPVVVGHSHGGGLAQCAAAANGIKGVVFNSRPMGAGVRRYIGQKKIRENSENIIAFSGKGDFLSHNRALNVLGVLTERILGFRIPRTVGKGYNLPPADTPQHNPTGVQFNFQHMSFYQQLEKML